MVQFLISPGYTNSGPNHWQTHLQNSYPSIDRIEHDNWDFVERDKWIQEVETKLNCVDDDVVLVGHSCGSNVIAQWSLSESLNVSKVKAAILVAPADVDNDSLSAAIKAQAPLPYEKLPFHTLVIGSDNDPYMPLETLRRLSDSWGASLEIVPNAGHLATDDGYGRWPEVVEYIESFSNYTL